MKNRRLPQRLWLLPLVFLSISSPAQIALSTSSRTVVAFVDVNVIPMDTERILRHQNVVVVGDRISKFGSVEDVDVPSGAVIIVGNGRYLMPGLADMHVHAWKEDLATYVANGVTTIRIMHGEPHILDWKRKIEDGTLLGPSIYSSSPTIDGPTDEYPDGVTTYQEAYAAVIAAGSAGYDFVKVYNSLSKDAYAGVIAAANEISLPIVGHVPFSVGLDGAVDAGQKSIEHLRGYIFKLVPASAPIQPGTKMRDRAIAWNYADRSKFESLAAATRDAGIWNCPTLVDMQHWSLPSKEYAELFNRTEVRYLSHRSRSWLIDRSKGWLADFSEDDFETARRALVVKKEFVGALHDAGARILLGTDDWMRGFAVVEELENLVDAGLSPYEAIKAGTRNAAEFVRAADEFGMVGVGMRADLLLLDGNPLDDVNNVRDVSGVMVGGKWLPRKELDEILEAIAVLIRTNVIG